MTSLPETFRDEWAQLAILSGLAGPNAQRFGYSMAIQWDAATQATLESIYAAMPSTAPDDALPYIGIDRQITRGYQESDASYVSRLQQWLDRWAYAGKPTGALMACIGWVLPLLPAMRVVTNQSRWFSYAAGTNPMPPGVQGSANVTPPAWTHSGIVWNWDGDAATRWRSWLIVDSFGPQAPFTQGTTWGSGWHWGDGTVWGLGSTSSTSAATIAAGFVNLVKQMKAAGAWYPFIIINFVTGYFSPTSIPGNVPDGTWGKPFKIVNGQYVPTRATVASYIPGVA